MRYLQIGEGSPPRRVCTQASIQTWTKTTWFNHTNKNAHKWQAGRKRNLLLAGQQITKPKLVSRHFWKVSMCECFFLDSFALRRGLRKNFGPQECVEFAFLLVCFSQTYYNIWLGEIALVITSPSRGKRHVPFAREIAVYFSCDLCSNEDKLKPNRGQQATNFLQMQIKWHLLHKEEWACILWGWDMWVGTGSCCVEEQWCGVGCNADGTPLWRGSGIVERARSAMGRIVSQKSLQTVFSFHVIKNILLPNQTGLFSETSILP